MSLSPEEIDELRPYIEKYIVRYVGHSDESLMECVEKCLTRGYDEEETRDRLASYIDEKKSKKLSHKIFALSEEVFEERRLKRKQNSSTDAKSFEAEFLPEVKKPKITDERNDKQPSLEQIREVMSQAQRQIQERQAQLNFSRSPNFELKSQKMRELQAKIASQMGALAGVLGASAADEKEKPVNVTIDKEGRTVDTRTGQVLQMENRLPTLKANIRAQKREAPKVEISKPETVNEPEESFHHIDPRVGIKPAFRLKRKMLVFHNKGKFEEMAKRLRAKDRLERLQKEIAQNVKKTRIATESKYVLLQQSKKSMNEIVPDMEWWDSAIISEPSYEALSGEAMEDLKKLSGISNLVEHPIQIKPPLVDQKKVPLPVYLTKFERKKLRRQNRADALREQQEKIRLGLAQPPEPKVRISNLMRVLGSEAVQDPSKIETYVRNQMEKRLKAHNDANAARKLTVEQKREKKKRKLMEDLSDGVHVAVYRILDLSDPAVKFKLEANCKQLYMTGCVVLCKELNVVVVEGGDDKTKNQRNKCSLVWEGLAKQRAFSDMQFKMSPSEGFAREFFRKHKVEHYWNIVLSEVVLENSDS